MKANVQKCIVIDGKPYLTAVSAAKSLAQLSAARLANRINLAALEAGIQEIRYRYNICGSWVPTPEDLDRVQYHRKRAYGRYKQILTRMLAA